MSPPTFHKKTGMRESLGGLALIEAMVALGIFSMVSVSVWALVFEIDNSLLRDLLRLEAISNIHTNLPRNFLSPELATTSERVHMTPCIFEYIERSGRVLGSVLVSDRDHIKKLGNDCGGYPRFLTRFSAVRPTSSPLFTEYTRATGVDVFKKHVFISLISDDEEEGRPDLIVADISGLLAGSSPDPPLDVLAINTGFGLNAIDVANGFVYGAVKSSAGQFAVIDATNPTTVFLTASSSLPGVGGVRPEGWSVAYHDSMVYVGTRRTAGHEFHIFNVSDPQHPVWLGSKEVNHNVNNIVVRDGVAFLATSGNSRDLIVLDVSVPQAISELITLNLPGNEDGRSLALLGDRLFLGRFKSTVGNPDFYIIDVANVRASSTASVLGSFVVGADVHSVAVQHDIAILGTAKAGATLQVVHIASSTNIFSLAEFDTGEKVTGVDYQDDVVFLSVFGDEQVLSINLRE